MIKQKQDSLAHPNVTASESNPTSLMVPQRLINQQSLREYQKEIKQTPHQKISSLQRRRTNSQKQEPRKKPWWMLLVGAVLSITVILAGLYYYFLHKTKENKTKDDVSQTKIISTTSTIKCEPGYVLANQKCIKCPQNTQWNGKQCKLKSVKAQQKSSLDLSKPIQKVSLENKSNKQGKHHLKSILNTYQDLL